MLLHPPPPAHPVTIDLVEDSRVTGADDATLDSGIWLGSLADATSRCVPADPSPPDASHAYRVRVVGLLRAAENRHYGNGGFAAELEARDIVYLDPARPECK